MKNKPCKISQEDWDSVNSPELSEDLLQKMRPVKESHPKIPPRVRGKQKSPTKTPVSIRLNSDVVKYFKSGGKGWQTKIDSILSEYVKEHS